MRRIWMVLGLLGVTLVGAATLRHGSNWQEFHYVGTRLMADLNQPDALIRTASLSKLPHDLLKVPLVRDVLTEDLAFYYEQQEDRMGVAGAIKRIAYEHNLDWTDKLLVSALNEPAEVAWWRDGKGALRHYALVLRRNMLTKVLQQAANIAMNDTQLKRAGELDTGKGKATILALEVNPRRTVLLISLGDRLVVLSDAGLLFDANNQIVPTSRAAVSSWLNEDKVLAKKFALDDTPRSQHTLVVGAPTLTLGYTAFLSGFKGLRFDFGDGWSTSAWINEKGLPTAGLGDAELWRAAPANPSACVMLPVDWRTAKRVVTQAEKKPVQSAALLSLDGNALACWYNESNLYSPVFIARLAKQLPDRAAALQSLAEWAMTAEGALDKTRLGDASIWRGAKAAFGATGQYVAFSPDGALVDKTLDTLAHTYPAIADQTPTSSATLAVMTPRPLSAMAEREMLQALRYDSNFLTVAQTHLPPRIQALAAYPAYRLELTGTGKNGWQSVEWRSAEAVK
ncbi:MAG: DUF2138 family protein [Gallionella sp.]|nr:DUF2138 family protein [Gallionella sp.]